MSKRKPETELEAENESLKKKIKMLQDELAGKKNITSNRDNRHGPTAKNQTKVEVETHRPPKQSDQDGK